MFQIQRVPDSGDTCNTVADNFTDFMVYFAQKLQSTSVSQDLSACLERSECCNKLSPFKKELSEIGCLISIHFPERQHEADISRYPPEIGKIGAQEREGSGMNNKL